MTRSDRYGLPISTASTAALDHYQRGMDRFLSWSAGGDAAFAAAVGADPECALAHAGVAACSFLQGDGKAARASIDTARGLATAATRRERQHVDALHAVMTGDTARGLALVEEHVAEFPRDALLVNQASSSIGFGGRADREHVRLGFVERLAPAYGDDWWYQTALAFAYHEVGRFGESRRLSERALGQHPENANACHNIAHIQFETADHEAGAAFLEAWLASYDRAAPYHAHLAWHLALFELQRGNEDRAREIYDRDIATASNARLGAIDGAALLWRLDLYGGREETRPWRPLAELAARVARPGFVFGDVHAALCYAACGDQAALDRLIDNLRALDAKGHPIAGTVALPLVQGAAAFASGDLAGALAHFEPVAGEIHRIGGSHAQWEVFEETMVACYLRLGRADEALPLIRRRLQSRQAPQDLLWLRQAEDALARTPSGGRAHRSD